MISWHRVGQKVVCVDDTPRPGDVGAMALIKKGDVLTVAWVGEGRNLLGETCYGFSFAEHPPHIQKQYGFEADRFKPVRETNISCFEAILRQVNDSVPA